MKITVTWTSTRLPDLLGSDFDILDKAKSADIASLSIQNTSALPIYVENGRDATADGSYQIGSQEEAEMNIANLGKLYFISDGTSLDVRIIAT